MDDDKYLRVLQVLESLDRDARRPVRRKIVSFVNRAVNTRLKRPAWLSNRALLVLAALFVACFLVWRQVTSGSHTLVHVDLRIEQHADGSLLIRWDPNSVRQAKDGVVEIVDGSEHHTLRLDSSQLGNGSILYSPATRDLVFRLDAFGRKGVQMSGFMRVINGSVTPPRFDGPELADNPPAPKPTAKSAVFSQRPRSFATETATATQKAPNLTAGFPQRRPARNSFLASTRKNSSELLSEAINLPARPLKQVVPSLADWDAVGLARPVDIDVQVSIDAEGHVSEAQVVNNAPDESNVLASAALIAAKQWIFEPAQVHGRRVPSDHRIVFHFQPQLDR